MCMTLGTLRRLAKMHKIAVTDPVSKNYWSKAALAVRLVSRGVSVCPRTEVGQGVPGMEQVPNNT